MAPTNQMRRAAATVVGVDVTAHKEERHITDVTMARKQSNTRVRYYVELVVGSPRESHTRLGFSGTFKALLRLHAAFEAIFNAKHAPLKASTSRESVSSATSASSASSSASNSHRRRVSAPLALGGDPDAPKIVGFPTSHALLVKLQPRQHVESDAKASARSDALFAYYSQLFNSEERELYLDYIQHRAERDATNKPTSNKPTSNNQHSHHAEEILHANEARGGAEGTTPQKRGFLKKLFGRRRHDGGAEEEETGHSSEHRRAAILDTKLEFAAPVHVTVKKNRRRM